MNKPIFVFQQCRLIKKLNILICPLDWGIGHATRCVPIIDELLAQGVNVIIGADKRPLAFLKNEYPNLKTLVFPGYKFSYPKNENMVLKMTLQLPRILAGIRKEHKLLHKIITDYDIDAVISDNRFGLWSKNVPTVFITHQLSVKMPGKNLFAENILFKLNKWFIQKYNECWIPDFEGENNLSGELSHFRNDINSVFYIGPLSRFEKMKKEAEKKSIRNEILVILSGPEPQRTILEKKILQELNVLDLKCIIIGGKTELYEHERINDKIQLHSHLNSVELNNLIANSRYIISRPGYSSIMDFAVLGKKAIFIPTPGQTEQEYLAQRFHKMKCHLLMNQNEIDLQTALQKIKSFKGIKYNTNPAIIAERVQNLIHFVSLSPKL